MTTSFESVSAPSDGETGRSRSVGVGSPALMSLPNERIRSMLYATEYIGALQELVREHGDLLCVDAHDEWIGTPEFHEGPESVGGVFVLADNS